MSVASVRRLGRYALHRQIAAGGMASVHLGRLMGPAGFSRTVAIKRLHPQFAQDAHFVTMFLDEARMTGRIVHPNIVSTVDVVQERGELFIVMDFVKGAALSTLLQASMARGEHIAPDVAIGIVLDALGGLHAAHEATGDKRQPLQIVHRDVSPHNILVGVDGLARIADFGIAKARGRMQQTAEGQIKGKLSYMPAEVIRGDDVDRRVDVYATAVVLWELLAGRKLFSGNEASILYDILEAELVPPSAHRAELPPGLDAVVMKGLARDRDGRYATAADMSEALEAIAARAPARKIGAWVAALASDDLEVRAALIEDLESTGDDVLPLGASQRIPTAPAPLPTRATRVERRDTPPSPAGESADVARGPDAVDEEPPDEAISLLHTAPPAEPGLVGEVSARRRMLRVEPTDVPRLRGRSVLLLGGAAVVVLVALVIAVRASSSPTPPMSPTPDVVSVISSALPPAPPSSSSPSVTSPPPAASSPAPGGSSAPLPPPNSARPPEPPARPPPTPPRAPGTPPPLPAPEPPVL